MKDPSICYVVGDLVKVLVGLIGLRQDPDIEGTGVWQTADSEDRQDMFLVISFAPDKHRAGIMWAKVLHPIHGVCWARAAWLTCM